jgi:hypothetical protein
MSLISLQRTATPALEKPRRTFFARIADTTYAYRRAGVIIVLGAFISVGGTVLVAQRQVVLANEQRELTLDQSNLAQQISGTLNDSSLQVAATARSLGLKNPGLEIQVPTTLTTTPLATPKFVGWYVVTPRTDRKAP